MSDAMIKEFDGLKDNEVELMMKAPLLTCILIAGADGTIDRKEIRESIQFVQANKDHNSLQPYLTEVAQDFEDKLKITLQSYPYESTQRNPLLVQELAAVSPILPKLEARFARAFYNMLQALAQRVATSSGGLLGIKKVAPEEARYLGLPMIQAPAK